MVIVTCKRWLSFLVCFEVLFVRNVGWSLFLDWTSNTCTLWLFEVTFMLLWYNGHIMRFDCSGLVTRWNDWLHFGWTILLNIGCTVWLVVYFKISVWLLWFLIHILFTKFGTFIIYFVRSWTLRLFLYLLRTFFIIWLFILVLLNCFMVDSAQGLDSFVALHVLDRD